MDIEWAAARLQNNESIKRPASNASNAAKRSKLPRRKAAETPPTVVDSVQPEVNFPKPTRDTPHPLPTPIRFGSMFSGMGTDHIAAEDLGRSVLHEFWVEI